MSLCIRKRIEDILNFHGFKCSVIEEKNHFDIIVILDSTYEVNSQLYKNDIKNLDQDIYNFCERLKQIPVCEYKEGIINYPNKCLIEELRS